MSWFSKLLGLNTSPTGSPQENEPIKKKTIQSVLDLFRHPSNKSSLHTRISEISYSIPLDTKSNLATRAWNRIWTKENSAVTSKLITEAIAKDLLGTVNLSVSNTQNTADKNNIELLSDMIYCLNENNKEDSTVTTCLVKLRQNNNPKTTIMYTLTKKSNGFSIELAKDTDGISSHFPSSPQTEDRTSTPINTPRVSPTEDQTDLNNVLNRDSWSQSPSTHSATESKHSQEQRSVNNPSTPEQESAPSLSHIHLNYDVRESDGSSSYEASSRRSSISSDISDLTDLSAEYELKNPNQDTVNNPTASTASSQKRIRSESLDDLPFIQPKKLTSSASGLKPSDFADSKEAPSSKENTKQDHVLNIDSDQTTNSSTVDTSNSKSSQLTSEYTDYQNFMKIFNIAEADDPILTLMNNVSFSEEDKLFLIKKCNQSIVELTRPLPEQHSMHVQEWKKILSNIKSQIPKDAPSLTEIPDAVFNVFDQLDLEKEALEKLITIYQDAVPLPKTSTKNSKSRPPIDPIITILKDPVISLKNKIEIVSDCINSTLYNPLTSQKQSETRKNKN